MTHKPTWRIVSFCILALLTLAWPAVAQTPTPPPTPREALIEAIQARAQRDVELGKPAEGVAALEVLFGAEAANVGLSMVEVLEVYEEAYTAATPVKPWWGDISPNTGWIAAIILFVLVIFRDALKDSLSKAVKWLLERIYLRLAGFRPFWGIALNRYRRALVSRYERLTIPFRPGRPLEMREVYVPLKVSGAQTTDLIEAYRALAEHKWLMITGAPGAGKTMLLRHLALHYAEGGLADFPTQPVPVLLELNRLSDSQSPLETHLAQALKANDFPGGERFIAAGLEHGMLLLLFDGLDEVARDARPRIVRQIKDLLQAHPKVRAIITCRTKVDNGEFDALVEQRLEIADFSDQQIQRFLASWQAQMPPDKSPKHLLRNLRERPHIMGLVRNPLLLTIIAYLYTDTPFVLPHSRTAFYDKALAVLLEQSDQAKGIANRYTVDEKWLVLQHLALYFQDHAARGGGDQRSVDLPTVLAEIARVLPALSRKAEDTRPLLDEIVARSGLLLALEGGLRYQFAHLTLQEFFTAQKLQDDTIGLMERFRADPDAWRETLKLWCGLPHESTVLIRALYAEHPILAFECLSDAQQVDEGLAQEIIIAFQARLGEDGATGEAVTRAFATVATNPQACGQQVFDFLAATVKYSTAAQASRQAATKALDWHNLQQDAAMSEDTTRAFAFEFFTTTLKYSTAAQARRRASAQALAWSNLPQAAAVLAECALDYSDARPLLAQMGDLATPVLVKWVEQSHEWAFDALQTVGTPAAAYALADLLWEEDKQKPYWAAWSLAALLDKPIITDALRAYPLTKAQRKAEYLEWIWEPFEPDSASALRVIAGRVAYLLDFSTATGMDPQALPPQFLLALCAVTAGRAGKLKELDKDALKTLRGQWRQILDPTSLTVEKSDVQKAFVVATREKVSQDAAWQRCVQGLPHAIQFEWMRRFVQGARLPDVADWRNLYRPNEYQFTESWHLIGLKALVASLLVLALLHLGEIVVSTLQLPSWNTSLNILEGLCLIGGGVLLIRARWTLGEVESFFLYFALFGGGGAFGAIAGVVSGNLVVGAMFGALAGAVSIGIFDFGAVFGGAFVSALGSLVGAAVGIVYKSSSAVVGAVGGGTATGLVSAIIGAVIGIVIGAVVGVVTYGPFSLLYDLWGRWGLGIFWGIWWFMTFSLCQHAKRCERAAANPLQGLLDEFNPTPVAPRRQGWASFLPLGLFSRRSRNLFGSR